MLVSRCRQDPRPGDCDHARHALELRRQQALVFPPVKRWASPRRSRCCSPCRRRSRLHRTARARRAGERRPRRGAVHPPHRRGPADRSASRSPASWRIRRSRSGSSGTRRTRRPRRRSTGDAAWTVKVWSGRPGRSRSARSRTRRRVSEAWTGPQVAWRMARGRVGSFGGKVLNAWWMWIGRSASSSSSGSSTAAGSLSWQPRPPRAALFQRLAARSSTEARSSTASRSPALPLAYLLVRTTWIGVRGRGVNPALVVPVWVLAAAGRVPRRHPGRPERRESAWVSTSGYAGVIGADRILDGAGAVRSHAGHRNGKACGKADREGTIRDRIQTNGRCESSNERGDTYGPAAYLVYVPAVAHARLVGQVGLAARGPRDGDRLRLARVLGDVSRRPAVRRDATGRDARVWLGRLSRSPRTP